MTAALSAVMVSFFLPLFILKETRVSPGTAVSIGEILFLSASVTLPVMMLLCVVLGFTVFFSSGSPLYGSAALVCGGAIAVLPWAVMGEAGRILIIGILPYGRVSPGPGLWLFMLASFLLAASRPEKIREKLSGALLAALVAVSFVLMYAIGVLETVSILREFETRKVRFIEELYRHAALSGSAVIAASAMGIPLAVHVYRRPRLRESVFFFIQTIQTIPSLAMFGLLMVPLSWLGERFPVLRSLGIQGIGPAPALFALTLYAFLPIVRNTFTSLEVVDRSFIQAGRGMGMTRFQLLLKVELPLALPIILGGIRMGAVQTIGNTAVAALISAGGLGVFIFQGLGQAAPDLILLGVIPVVLLAIFTGSGFRLLQSVSVPGRRIHA